MAEKKQNPWMWIAVVAIIVLIGGGAILFSRKPSPQTKPTPAATTAAAKLPAITLHPPAPWRSSDTKRRPRPVVSELTATSTTLQFKVEIEPNVQNQRAADPVVLAVPAGKELKAEVIDWTADPVDPLYKTTEAPADAADPQLEVRPLGWLRHNALAAVHFRNAFFNGLKFTPGQKGAKITARIRLNWTGTVDLAAAPPFPAEADPAKGWGRMASFAVDNPQHLKAFQSAPAAITTGPAPQPSAPWLLHPGERKWARLRIAEEGLYRLDLDDLLAIGFTSAEIKPAAARLFSGGKAVPVLREGTGAGQKVYLWAAKPSSPYSATQVYWLTFGDDLPDALLTPLDPAPLLADADTLTTTSRRAVLDIDKTIKIQSDNFLSISHMAWVAEQMKPGLELAVPLDLASPAPRAADLHLTFFVEGKGRANFKVTATASGAPVGEVEIRSAKEAMRTLKLPANLLKPGSLPLSLRLDAEGDPTNAAADTTLWFDKAELVYAADPIPADGRLTLADDAPTTGRNRWSPLAPESIAALGGATAIVLAADGAAESLAPITEREGRRGIAWPRGAGRRVEFRPLASAPKTPHFESVAADDLTTDDSTTWIIAHRDFMEEAARLKTLHEGLGESVRVIDVQSVYDNFSDGDLSPAAIQSAIAHALRTAKGGGPARVLLIGDATSDYLNVAKTNVRNWVPSYRYKAGTDGWASDHWLTLALGEDDLPDVMLGRISVNNRKDLKHIVDKVVQYAEKPRGGEWRGRIGYVADDGGFNEPAEELRTKEVPPAYDDITAYLDDHTPLEDNFYLPAKLVADKKLKVSPKLTWQIRDMFEQGLALMTYYGHGSPNIWMEEHAWFGGDSTNSDNQHLAGTGFTPFVVTFTCNTGAIDYPMPRGTQGGGWNVNISEDMMRVENGGAIGLFVPSGPESTETQHRMSLEFNRGLFECGLRNLGELTALARARYLALGYQHDMAYMMILLGDPSLDLALTREPRGFKLPKPAYEPGDAIAATLEGIAPTQGKCRVTLEDATGNRLIETEQRPYDAGRIDLKFTIPADAPLGEARLRVYASDEKSVAELAAGTSFKIAHPDLRALSAAFNTEGKLELILQNTSPIPAEGQVNITPPGATTPHKVPATCDANSTRALALADPFPAQDASVPRVYTVTAFPKGRVSAARPIQVVAPVIGAWRGLLPEASHWSYDLRSGSGTVHAVALAKGEPAESEFLIGLDSFAGRNVAGSTHKPDARGLIETDLDLRGAPVDQITSGTLWLKRSTPAGPGEEIDRKLVRTVPFDQPLLTLVQDSATLSPEVPFEGGTLFVQCTVRNDGAAESSPFTASLYDGDPADGGQVYYDHIRSTATQSFDPLGPGAERRLTLRADPIQNSGDRKVFLRIEPATAQSGQASDPRLSHLFTTHVRRKADLKQGSVTVEQLAPAKPGEKPRLKLTGSVANGGETDAFNVLVIFYRADLRTAEDVLGQSVIPAIHGGETGTTSITIPWDNQRIPDLAAFKPTEQLRLNWRRDFKAK